MKVFETLRTYNGEIFELEKHLARLENSAQIVGIGIPAVRDAVQKAMEDHPDIDTKRLRVVASPEDVTVEVFPLDIDPAIYDGVSATFYESERHYPEAKSLPYTVSLEANEYAESRGFYEAFLVDDEGNISEGAYSNIFWVKDGKVFTRENGVLPGITRGVVLDLVDVNFATTTPDEIKGADEIFISKTTTGVVPITEIDGQKIGDGKPGPVTENLKRHFANLENVSGEVN